MILDTRIAIALLTEARRRLEGQDLQQPGICYALDLASLGRSVQYREVYRTLVEYIARQLLPHTYLSEYLAYQFNFYLPNDVLLLCRLAWIDRMIHQLKLNGTLP